MNETEKPTRIAKRVRRVKNRVMRIINTREKLPRNLFWSLFHTELRDIKEKKNKERVEREVWLSGLDSDENT